MILGGGVFIALVWFFLMEVYRGRPTTSGNVSFILKFINPIVAIAIMLGAWFIHLQTR
jgi:hypothetical protein